MHDMVFDGVTRVLAENVRRRGVLGLIGALAGAAASGGLRANSALADKGPGLSAAFADVLADGKNSNNRKKRRAK